MYEPINLFMLRTPTWSVEKFNQLNAPTSLQQNLLNSLDESLTESILIASSNLYGDLPNLKGELNKKKTQQVIGSVFKYASRMSTRPTPFGLFAGVSVGAFGDRTAVELQGIDQHKKRARPDMEWLLSIVSKLEDNRQGMEQIKVSANPLVLKAGGRYILSYSTNYGKQAGANINSEKISIKSSEAIDQVFELSRKPIILKELVEKMAHKYVEVDSHKIKEFVMQLLKQEFLISELRPPLTIESPFHYIMKKIENITEYRSLYKQLSVVDRLISQYNRASIGEGVPLYKELIHKMKELAETKNFLQVDLALAKQKIILNKKVGTEAAKAAEVLWLISQTQKGVPHLKKYKNRFLERYGRNREIPILELLNDETGLGPPEEYVRESTDLTGDTTNIEREFALLKAMQAALLNKSYIVELDDKLIEKIGYQPSNEMDAPGTVELYGEVLADSSQDIDEGDFLLVISPNPGSGSCGQTFGRFLDILDPTANEILTKTHHERNRVQTDVIMADAVYFPTRGRAANISLAPGLQEYELVLGTNSANNKKNLCLDDIVVGATLDRLYLKSVSLGKEIIFTANHMLNYRSAPPLYRFLREVSLENFRIWHSFDWGTAKHAPFLPRVQYQKIILSPAKWKLTPELLGFQQEPDDRVWNEKFENWKKEWMVPRFVYMGATDERILFDLAHPDHCKILKRELFHKGKMVLFESFHEKKSYWIKDLEAGEHFIGEFVFPLKKINKDLIKSPVSPLIKTSSSVERLMLPGSRCLYLKLYTAKSRQNEFIGGPLYQFSSQIIESGFADKWFFIRYADPESHVRVRFFGDPSQLCLKVLPNAHKWSQWCLKEGLISKMTIDAYDPELERYGGPKLISHAESIFEADSMLTAHLVKMIRYGTLPFPEEVIGTINLIDFMYQFGMDFDERLSWLDLMVDKNEHRQKFQPWRKQLIQITLEDDVWEHVTDEKNKPLVKRLASRRQSAILDYLEHARVVQKQGELWNDVANVLGSLLHMTCNRLMGDNNKEKIARAYARHTLYSQVYLRRLKSGGK
jgi:lantibiotic biosynthesis protein